MKFAILDGYYIFNALKKCGLSSDKLSMKVLIESTYEKLGATHGLVVFPDMASNHRKSVIDTFPLNRKGFSFLDLHQMGMARKAMQESGIATLQCVNISFVDVCATIIDKLSKQEASYSLMTDCPLCLQLISDSVSIVTSDLSKTKDSEWIAKQYMMPSSMIPDYYAIVGLSGLGIPKQHELDSTTLSQSLLSFGGLYGVNVAITDNAELGSLSGLKPIFSDVTRNYVAIKAKSDAKLGLSLNKVQISNQKAAA
ncbi:hypothetical protein LMH73_010645 [Vibrio splendidus]|nr:hypothetical protein [Vibrio splendidus]MCC4880405.1 hypothetical protein [Vibrio splendidus]